MRVRDLTPIERKKGDGKIQRSMITITDFYRRNDNAKSKSETSTIILDFLIMNFVFNAQQLQVYMQISCGMCNFEMYACFCRLEPIFLRGSFIHSQSTVLNCCQLILLR